MLLFCTSPWDKCLFLVITNKTFVDQKQKPLISCLESRKEVKFMTGNWGKVIHLL